jgi:glutamine synthetase
LAHAILGTQDVLGKSAGLGAQKEILKKIAELANKIYAANKDILAKIDAVSSVHNEQKKAEVLCSNVKAKMDELREYVDELEVLVENDLWPMPKFWEMLFIN